MLICNTMFGRLIIVYFQWELNVLSLMIRCLFLRDMRDKVTNLTFTL